MEEKELKIKVQQLSKPSLARFMAQVVWQWALLAAAIGAYVAYPSIPMFFLASIVVGISQHGLVVLGHEGVHFCITRKKWLNDFIGSLFCFYPVGMTVTAYRDFHFPHHKTPTSPEDPETPLRRDLGRDWVPTFSMKKGMRLWFLSFFGFSLRETLVFVKCLPMGNVKDRVGMLLFWGVASFIAYKTGHLSVIGLCYYALVTTYFSHMRIQGWHEHSLSESNDVMTSRYSLPNPLYRLLMPNNIWLHYEHHKYPNIPFYRLEQVRELDQTAKIFSFEEMVDAELVQHQRQSEHKEKLAA
ncbi:MAG: fatty acid desaturase [Bdellovibrionota bacterium]